MAIFPNELAADQAAEELRGWEKANDEIKSGSIGVLVKDNNGKIKEQKLGLSLGLPGHFEGERETARGAGVGLVLGIIVTVLSGGLALVAGVSVVGGIIVGGLIGSLVHHGLGMSDEDLRLLGEHLDAGRAAVAVLVPENEAAETSAELKKLGGDITTYQVSEEALQQAEEAAKAAGA